MAVSITRNYTTREGKKQVTNGKIAGDVPKCGVSRKKECGWKEGR
jgi:hypothetical protein